MYFSTSLFPTTIRSRENQGVVLFSLCPNALQRLSKKISHTIRLMHSAHSKYEKAYEVLFSTWSRNDEKVNKISTRTDVFFQFVTLSSADSALIPTFFKSCIV